MGCGSGLSATSASPAARSCASSSIREGLLRHFSGWAFSDEVGHYKPDPRIFEAALSALEATPPAGRSTSATCAAPTSPAPPRLGMRTVRYRGVHDDLDSAPGVEADHVLDDHRELLDVIVSLRSRLTA